MKYNMQYNSSSQIAPLYGLVLCGGQSTRMGSDKSAIHYHNKPQREYLFDLLSLRCYATFISCNATQAKHIMNKPFIKDAFENLGPLAGILSAFRFNSTVAWIAVACDMPFLNQETITYLIDHRNSSKFATTFWNPEMNFIEPLVTIWEPSAYKLLVDFFKAGNKSPGKFLVNNNVEILEIQKGSVFRNINTKTECDEVRRMGIQDKLL